MIKESSLEAYHSKPYILPSVTFKKVQCFIGNGELHYVNSNVKD